MERKDEINILVETIVKRLIDASTSTYTALRDESYKAKDLHKSLLYMRIIELTKELEAYIEELKTIREDKEPLTQQKTK